MKWYKASNTITIDPTFAVIAKKSKSYKCEVLALWFHLLERASRKSEAGFIGDIDHEEASMALDIPSEKVMAIIVAMADKCLIEKGYIKAWGKFQIDPTNAERQKAYRNRHKSNDSNSYVTENNAVTLEESRGEESRYTADVSLHQKIEKLMQGKILVLGRIDAWLKSGADENLILEVIERLMKKRNNDPPSTLKYFDQAIADAILQKNQPLPKGKVYATNNREQKDRAFIESGDRILALTEAFIRDKNS